MKGTELRHKGNGSNSVGAAVEAMAVTVEGDGNDILSKNSGEITVK